VRNDKRAFCLLRFCSASSDAVGDALGELLDPRGDVGGDLMSVDLGRLLDDDHELLLEAGWLIALSIAIRSAAARALVSSLVHLFLSRVDSTYQHQHQHQHQCIRYKDRLRETERERERMYLKLP
jgi:hypothetical protein